MEAPEGFTLLPFTDTQRGEPVETPVYVTTLPKGTLLYRGVKTLDTLYQDLYGVQKDTKSYCLPPEYNVFFYPFPFADAAVADMSYTHLLAYVTMQDIKLASFVSPSPMIRGDRNQGLGPITSCYNISAHGCELSGRDYDPCFKPEFRAAHPDVSGMIAIADMDRKTFLGTVRNYKEPTPLRDYLNQYVSAYTDATGKPGVPELILHPFVVRPTEDMLTPSSQTLTGWYGAHEDKASYRLWHTVKRTDSDILQFLEQITGKGLNGSRVKLDTRTGFYVCEAEADEETRKHLVRIQKNGEWAMGKEMPGFRFRRGTIEIPNISEEEYDEKVASLSKRIADAIRGAPVDRTKYANRLAHALGEAILRVMVIALGYYDALDDEAVHSVKHDTACAKALKPCGELVDTALATIARPDLADEHEEADGETKPFAARESFPIDNATAPESNVFESWHEILRDALMDASFDPNTGTYDRPKMIESAASVASRLLHDSLDFAFEVSAATDGDLQARHVVTENIRAVEELLTTHNDYGEPGWVNLAFDHHFGDGRWGDWTDEDEEEDEEESETVGGKTVNPKRPTGARRRRTYRRRKTSLRRRR